MESCAITGGGLQYPFPVAAVQYIYLDFDGANTSYNGELLTLSNVEVQNPQFSPMRIEAITAALNARYASQSVLYVTQRPENTLYSTIFIGKTAAFDQYGSFTGVAETIDKNNMVKNDNAFVMLDNSAEDSRIIDAIGHETDHLLGTLDHGGEGLAAYAADYEVGKGETSTGVVLNNGKMWVLEGGVANDTTAIDANLYISKGGIASNTILRYDTVMYVYGSAYKTEMVARTAYRESAILRISGGFTSETTVSQAGYMYVDSGGFAENTTIHSQGTMHVLSKGKACSTTVNSWGTMSVYAGAHVTSTTVNRLGSMYVKSATATDTIINSGGYVSLGYLGSSLRTTVASGGKFNIYSATASHTTVNSDGVFSAHDKSVASDTIVNTGGKFYISSGASAHRTSVLGNGTLKVSNGGKITETQVNEQGNATIDNGGIAIITLIGGQGVFMVSGNATSTTVNNGMLQIFENASALSTVMKGGFMSVSNGFASSTTISCASVCLYGGIADMNTVSDGGVLMTSTGGGILTNTTLLNGGRMKISAGGVHKGVLNIAAGAAVSVYEGGIIDFTVANRETTDGYLINDLSLISGTPAYTITVAVDQAPGVYKLAQGAENFSGPLSIGDGNIHYGDITVNGEDISGGTLSYSLKKSDGNLTLVVAEQDCIPPENPVAVADVTALTGKDVFVTATFAEDSVRNEYSKNGADWLEYTGSIRFEENGYVSFRSWDEVGNVSEITTCVVANIDREPLAPPGDAQISLEKNNATIVWLPPDNTGAAGVISYLCRFGRSAELTGEGLAVINNKIMLDDLHSGEWYFQIAAIDALGRISSWSDVQSFTIQPFDPENLSGSPAGVSWESAPYAESYVVEYITADRHVTVATSQNAIDTFSLPAGDLQWGVRNAENATLSAKETLSGNGSPAPQKYCSDANGIHDLFFADPAGVWGENFIARHQTTGEEIVLEGKNRFDDVFKGSSDANILWLTDDNAGDAFFIDDVYTALGSQARFSQINKIFAGAGDDIIDMTSKRFIFEGDTITLHGGAGDDILWGGAKANLLYGDAGKDRLVGAAGNDTFYGGADDDSMSGGGGDDIFFFSGNWGQDTVEQHKRGTITLCIAGGAEEFWNAETLTYDDGNNKISVIGCRNISFNFEIFSESNPENLAFENSGKAKLA